MNLNIKQIEELAMIFGGVLFGVVIILNYTGNTETTIDKVAPFMLDIGIITVAAYYGLKKRRL